ncbi:MAG: Obg family GTPase CgtA [Planctomycetes bacterium]|nr:Obg family GTPase CgtA [Planctomycetota bacterium]MCP4837785.1 Obg family GTPase CgtA [Planctomycetota bacterium]
MLVDRCTIFICSGKGGNGCVSLRREKYRPKGGPDGGNGGNGGDVVLVGEVGLSTLLSLTPRPHFRAKNGMPGQGSSKHGPNADHLLIPVPLGTIAVDRESGVVLAEITSDGEHVVVAKGGEGGFGNEHFKSATNQTPREGTPGGECEERTLDLELKLLADVGFVGLPNAGKSTLLAAITAARPKIAAYPFTTKSPHLGIAELPGERRLVMADLPGLIEGAAEGAGMGYDFLKHVERTAVILHVLDAAPIDGSDPLDNWRMIRGELEAFGDVLMGKPELVLLNKCDLIDETTRASLVKSLKRGTGCDVMTASGMTGDGVEAVMEQVWNVARPPLEMGWKA